MCRSSPSLFGVWLAVLLALPAYAHKTEVSGNVAGTWHLEPNHNPKTGEPAKVWVALTQSGGQTIPLAQCDCQLAIYAANQPDSSPIITPTLEAISPENFQSIPGAEITFPNVGEYRLVLTGRPRAGADFTPFELSYTTVVAAGSAPPTTASAQADKVASPSEPSPSEGEIEPSESTKRLLPWAIGGIVGAAALVLWLALRRQRNAPNQE
jgi:hypothetical protein